MCFDNVQMARWTLDESMPNLICPCVYDAVYSIGKYILVCLDGKWGTLDKLGRTAIPAEYAYIPWSIGDYAVAVTFEEEFLIVDSRGQAAPERYAGVGEAMRTLEAMQDHLCEDAQDEGDGSAPGRYRNVLHRYTYDIQNQLMIPCLHGETVPLTDEYQAALEKGRKYSVRADNLWGLIESQSGRPILPFAYEDVNMIDRHLVKIKSHGKWGIADARISAFFPDARRF